MTSPSKLPIAWFIGCNGPEEKEAREQLVRNSTQFATILLQILAQHYDTIEKKGLKEEDYGDTSWMTLQAFRNGKMAEIADIANLFSYLKGDK